MRVKSSNQGSIIKQLHGEWLIEMYNKMALAEGRYVFSKEWQVAAIKDEVKLGLFKLPCLNADG